MPGELKTRILEVERVAGRKRSRKIQKPVHTCHTPARLHALEPCSEHEQSQAVVGWDVGVFHYAAGTLASHHGPAVRVMPPGRY